MADQPPLTSGTPQPEDQPAPPPEPTPPATATAPAPPEPDDAPAPAEAAPAPAEPEPEAAATAVEPEAVELHVSEPEVTTPEPEAAPVELAPAPEAAAAPSPEPETAPVAAAPVPVMAPPTAPAAAPQAAPAGTSPQPDQPDAAAQPVPLPAPVGYYPQETYYAPGWTQPASQPRSHRGRTITVFSALAVVVLAVVGTVTAATLYWMRTKPVGDVTSPTSATSRQVRAGHCIRELPSNGSVGTVTLVPCADDHEAEVIGSLRLDDGDWPGDDAVAQQAGAWCEMDNTQVEAGYRPVVWTPSEQSWSQGDRVALCIAWLDN